MSSIRKKHTIQEKVKVSIEAIRGEKSTSEIISKYGIHGKTTQKVVKSNGSVSDISKTSINGNISIVLFFPLFTLSFVKRNFSTF